MSSTNKTTHYELPQFVENDIFNPLVDDNDAYEKIDTALYNIADAEADDAAEIVGIKSRLDTAEGKVEALETQNGTDVLTTVAQTLSGAVNELKSGEDSLDGRLDVVEDDVNNASTGLKVKVTALENQNGSEELTTVAQTLSGGINELKSREDALDTRLDTAEDDIERLQNLPNDMIYLTKIGSIFSELTDIQQGACMISDTMMAQWFRREGGNGKIRLVNIDDGTYTDYETTIPSHGNSMAFNGEVVAISAGYMHGAGLSDGLIYYFDPTLPTSIQNVDVTSLFPPNFGDTIAAIAWDSSREEWIMCGNENFATGKSIMWVSKDFTQRTKYITITNAILGSNVPALQDMTYDGENIYLLMIDPYSVIAIDPNNGEIRKFSKLDSYLSDGMYYSEPEAIDYHGGKFIVTCWSAYQSHYYRHYIDNYCYFSNDANVSRRDGLTGRNMFVDGVYRYKADGTNDKPYMSLSQALLVDAGKERRISITADLDEPLVITNDVVNISGNNHKVKGVLIKLSNVRLDYIKSNATITDDATATFNFWRTTAVMRSCTENVTLGANEYVIAAYGNSIVFSNYEKTNVKTDDSSRVDTSLSPVQIRPQSSVGSFEITMPAGFSTAGALQGLLIADNRICAFSFVQSTTTCSCSGSDFTVSKAANSTTITFTCVNTNIPPYSIITAIPLY